MSIETFLSELKKLIEKKELIPDYLKSSSSFNGFEHLVSDVLVSLSPSLQANNIEYVENFGHFFPDIDAIIDGVKYGIELKSRTDGSWTNNGGSVFESISNTDYEEIFVLFGTINKTKQESHYRVRYAPYWQVTESIKVTHKPRYFLNMNARHSVFSSPNDYKSVRHMSESEKNTYVQKKLRESTNKPQWYIADTDDDSVQPTLISDIPKETKENVVAELMILFPQDLLKSRSNYDTSTEYLISTYFYYCSSIRDLFSSGGRKELHGVLFPRIIINFREHRLIIKHVIDNQSADFRKKAYESWDKLNLNLPKDDFFNDYKLVLNAVGNTFLAEELDQAEINDLSTLIFH